MVRKSALAAMMAAAMAPAGTSALGLGSINLNSALNQPLTANIDLLSVKGDELNNLEVRLADSGAFDRAGIDRPFFLSKLRFKVKEGEDGRPYILVTTDQAVREPYLDFLIEVNWANGRLVREYALLLDPPITQDKPAPQVQQAVVVAQSEFSGQVSDVVPQEPVVPPPVQSREYGPTTPTDTLWSVAKRLRPDDSFSMPQIMMALLKNNPQAFESNNVNGLRSGYVMRLPDDEIIRELSRVEASQAFKRQMAEWENLRLQLAKNAGERPINVTAQDKPAATASDSVDAKLRVMTPSPEKVDKDADGQSGGADEAVQEAQELERRLALAAEETDAVRQENDSLRERLARLEEQMRSMQRLIELKDEAMAEVQAKIAEREEKAAEPAPQPVPAPQPQAVAPQPAPVTPPPVAPPPQPAAAPSFIDDMLSNTTNMLAIGGVVLLGLLGGLLVIRRKRLQDEQADNLYDVLDTAEQQKKEEAPVSESLAGLQDGTEGQDDLSLPDSSEGVLEDPLAEADVYIAYGHYSQAEALLEKAIDADPANAQLKLKLLEVFGILKDAERFCPYAEQNQEQLQSADPAVWERISDLGAELCPESPLFAATAAATAAGIAAVTAGAAEAGAPSDDALEFDIQLDDPAPAPAADTAEPSQDDGLAGLGMDGDELDLDFDFPEFDKDNESAPAPEPTSGDDDLGLDMDLSFDVEQEPVEAKAAPEAPADDDAGLDFDFDLGFDEPAANTAAAPAEAPEADLTVDGDDTGLDLDFSLPDSEPVAETVAEAPAEDDNALDFDLGDLGFSSMEDDAEASAADEPDLDSLTSSLDELTADDAMDLDLNALDLGDGDDDLSALDADLADTPVASGGDALGGLSDADPDLEEEVNTKLELADAYIGLGDLDGAREILQEVLEEGSENQKSEAQNLMKNLG